MLHIDTREQYLIVTPDGEAALCDAAGLLERMAAGDAPLAALDLIRARDNLVDAVLRAGGDPTRTYVLAELAGAAGVARTTLIDWYARGILRPSVRTALPGGRGQPRRFAARDLWECGIAGALARLGLSHAQLTAAMRAVERVGLDQPVELVDLAAEAARN
jgi:hypothetical protein